MLFVIPRTSLYRGSLNRGFTVNRFIVMEVCRFWYSDAMSKDCDLLCAQARRTRESAKVAYAFPRCSTTLKLKEKLLVIYLKSFFKTTTTATILFSVDKVHIVLTRK